MGLLPLETIRQIHGAAIALRLSRDALLSGIDIRFVGALPLALDVGSQLYGDLMHLNGVEQLDDGSTPIRVWLENAYHLSQHHRQAKVFAEALSLLSHRPIYPQPDERATEDLAHALEMAKITTRRPIEKIPTEAGLSNALEMAKTRAQRRVEELPTVFVSYSHHDEEWKRQLLLQLQVLGKQGVLDAWDDRRIGAGEDWKREIELAIERASIAVLLVTADFLSSDFVLGEEMPRLLGRRQKEGLRIVPILVRPCLWKAVSWLSAMQLRTLNGKAISAGSAHDIEHVFAGIAEEIYGMLTGHTTTR